MNELEKLQAMLLMTIKRVEVLEAAQAAGKALDADEAAAQLQAQELGFAPTILFVPAKRTERVALARKLRAAGWSVARISRVMRTGERNIERWVRAAPAGKCA